MGNDDGNNANMLGYANASGTWADGDTSLFWSIVRLGQPKHSLANYFSKAHSLMMSSDSVPFLPRSFIADHIAINIARDLMINRDLVNNIATQFQILDLHAVLGDYLHREMTKLTHSVSGPHLSAHDCHLPFMHLAVWHMVWLQQTPYYSTSNLDPTQAVIASPSSASWKYRCYNTVVFNVDPDKSCLWSGLSDELIFGILSIFHPLTTCVSSRSCHRRASAHIPTHSTSRPTAMVVQEISCLCVVK